MPFYRKIKLFFHFYRKINVFVILTKPYAIVSQTFKILTSPIIPKSIRFSISIAKTMHLL